MVKIPNLSSDYRFRESRRCPNKCFQDIIVKRHVINGLEFQHSKGILFETGYRLQGHPGNLRVNDQNRTFLIVEGIPARYRHAKTATAARKGGGPCKARFTHAPLTGEEDDFSIEAIVYEHGCAKVPSSTPMDNLKAWWCFELVSSRLQ